MIPLFDGLNETKFVDAIKMVRDDLIIFYKGDIYAFKDESDFGLGKIVLCFKIKEFIYAL